MNLEELIANEVARHLRPGELMVGNWVMYDHNVFEEDEYVPTRPVVPEIIHSGEEVDLAIEDCFYPMILTPAHLEKNGWEVKNGVCYLHAESPAGVTVWLEWRESNRTLFIGDALVPVPVISVHQMQNVLTVCGLGEKARNFEI